MIALTESLRTLPAGELPVLDLEAHRRGHDRATFGKDLDRALREYGFLVVKGHGVDLDLLDRCYTISEAFFARPIEDKLRYHYADVDQRRYGNLGYFPNGSEQAIRASKPDLKDFFHVGPTLPPEHPMRAHYAETPWPDLEGFRPAFEALFRQLQACGDLLLSLVGAWGGLDADYLRDLVDGGNHVLRTLHYPPCSREGEVEWAAEHTGIQLLGLQPRTSAPGLEIMLPSGEWIIPRGGYEDLIIVNIGEMLSYLLAGRIPATLHRVRSRPEPGATLSGDRYAIVFFYHANALRMLKVEGGTTPPIQAGEWLRQRLVELGLTPGAGQRPVPG